VPADDCKCSACGTEDDDLLFAANFDAAAQFLFDATCRRFPGICHVVLSPCPDACECSCACVHACNNCDLPTMDLRDHLCYPVAQNPDGTFRAKIIVDGIEWVYGVDYWMSDGYTLHACRPWPTCQNLCTPPGQPGTWEIVLAVGANPPRLLQRAASDLACEMVKACKGQDHCMPDSVKSVSRRGVSMEFEKIEFDGERLGIPSVDLAIKHYGCTDGDAWETFVRPREQWRYTHRTGPYPIEA
jgi:hypothetical protein